MPSNSARLLAATLLAAKFSRRRPARHRPLCQRGRRREPAAKRNRRPRTQHRLPEQGHLHVPPRPGCKASLGYGLGNGLRAEIEGDYASNVVRGAQGLTPNGSNPPRRAGSIEIKYGGFLNVLYDVDLGLPVQPFIGLGAGAQAIEHRGFNQSVQGVTAVSEFADVELPPGTHLGFRDQTNSGFAYQAIAGFAYAIPSIPGLSLTTEYHFIGLLDPLPAYQLTQRRVDFFRPGPPGTPIFTRAVALTGNRKFGNDLNHEILVGFRYALFQPPAPLPPASPVPLEAVPIPGINKTYLVFFDWDRADSPPRPPDRRVSRRRSRPQPDHPHRRQRLLGPLRHRRLQSAPLHPPRQYVQAELVRDGVSQSEIAIHGFGETSPLIPTAPGVREPQNRRVEIILH